METIRKKRFFLPVAALLAVVAAGICFGVNTPKASALSGCEDNRGTRTVTFINQNQQHVSLGTYQVYETLRYGSTDPCVAQLQKMANVFCTPSTRLQVDSQFGPKTYRAVKTLQYVIGHGWFYPVRVNGSSVSVDGVAGPQTWSILQAFSYWGSPILGGSVDCTYMR